MQTLHFLIEAVLVVALGLAGWGYLRRSQSLRHLQRKLEDLRFTDAHYQKRIQRLEELLTMQQGLFFSFERVDGAFVYTMCYGTMKGRFDGDEMVGKSLYEAFSPDIASALEPYYERAWRGENPVRYEVTSTTGHDYVCLLSPIRDGGEVVEVVGLAVETTDQKRMALSLQQSEQRYQRLVEMSPEGIALIADGHVVYVNPAGLEILGASRPDEILGVPALQWIREDQRAEVVERAVRAVREQTVMGVCEVQVTRLDGELIDLEVTGVGIRYEAKPAIQVLFRDVTARNRTEELLMRAKTHAVVGEIAAGIAHEIRNPLTVVRGFAQLMNAGQVSRAPQYSQWILAEADKIDAFLSELLLFAEPQSAAIGRTDLKSLLCSVKQGFEAQATEHNVTLHTDLNCDRAFVVCDESQLRQAFANILQNALDAMPQGGEVHIRMHSTARDQITVEIADNGPGIAASRIPMLGEPYYTTKEKGIGLGLMISFHVIHRFGGTIVIDSTVGQGTKVTVTLPAVLGSLNEAAEGVT
jgi:PAS domain S-box-containing protein